MNGDMRQAIIPKSDQLNSDDLIGVTLTVKISGVTVRGGQEQPVSIHFDGDNGKPYKPCKSMCRVMVTAWGADSSKYVGRSMTLYRDPAVKWGGMEVGGIRISHMTDIAEPMTMALTATKGSRKAYTVKPLVAEVAEAISKEQALAIDAACSERGISIADFKEKAGIDVVSNLLASEYEKAMKWIKRHNSAKTQANTGDVPPLAP